MKFKKVQIFFLISLSILLQSCTMPTENIESIAQTNSASQIEEYKKEILESLIEYKKRLDLRNPNTYNKQIDASLEHQNIKKRNDFLIIGLYKLILKLIVWIVNINLQLWNIVNMICKNDMNIFKL